MSELSTKKSDTPTETPSAVRAFRAFAVFLVTIALGYFVYSTTVAEESTHPFKLGLDLAGGSHLVYEADVSKLDPEEVPELMQVLKEVIERRVNIFGVSEPIVQVEQSSFVSEEVRHRLVIELPGVTDVEEAVAEIGRTPLLEFKLVNQEALAAEQALEQLRQSASGTGAGISNVKVNGQTVGDRYIDTGLTGRYFKHAEAQLPQNSIGSGFNSSPFINITFNDEGAKLFEDITRNNVGENLAIILDGEELSAPRINEAIGGGRAVITGDFTREEVQDLAQNLNFGALPVPIELQTTQTIGASLGGEILERGITAGVIGLSLVIAFMLLWYRVPGAVAGVALITYTLAMLSLFKLIPVTLTAAGLAGFILSVGMAVDANVLVFERMKEEYASGKGSRESARVGFARAWNAIRDGNVTSLLSAVVLYWVGTSLVKGFALVFGIGVIVSMLTALVITRTLLIALPDARKSDNTLAAKLFGTGFQK